MKHLLIIFMLGLNGFLMAQDNNTYLFFNTIYTDSIKPCSLSDSAIGLELSNDTSWGFYKECKKILSQEDFNYMWKQKSPSFKWDMSKLRNTHKCNPTYGCLHISSPIYSITKEWAIVSEESGTRHCGSSGIALYRFINGKWVEVAGRFMDW